MSYRLCCMAFDGDIQIERPKFDTIEDAWNHSDNIGSKWYFYPFHFVLTESKLSIADCPDDAWLQFTKRRRLKTVQKMFRQASELPEAEHASITEMLVLLNRFHV